ncbi:MAG: septal ring lytic transglycosylase RlpA family protein [Azoarcus sp.]|jgi:rare lipoprotein A|nr:septal ring lytic transglycosylase RlpA family protein [Azoarcus sp.]
MNAHGAALRRLGAIVAAALILAACHSTPPRKPPAKKTAATRPAAKPRPAPATRSPAPSQQSGGAYYKDDGPGGSPPDNLASLPDAEPRAEPLNPRFNRPYRVFGKQYVPRTRLEPYRQRGTASWYGRRFHGLPTSSGEPYDMYAMTAAHPTLPIPSYARVTHLGNGHSVVVRINDRGPFLHGRIIDLSYAAAFRLGYINAGSAMVEVEQLLPGNMTASKEAQAELPPMPEPTPIPEPATLPTSVPEPEPPLAPIPMPVPWNRETAPDTGPLAPIMTEADTSTHVDTPGASKLENTPDDVKNASILAPESGQNLFLQLGLFTSRENAESFRDRAMTRLAGLFGQIELRAEEGYFRLFIGPYPSPAAAHAAAARIGELLDIQPFTIWRDLP